MVGEQCCAGVFATARVPKDHEVHCKALREMENGSLSPRGGGGGGREEGKYDMNNCDEGWREGEQWQQEKSKNSQGRDLKTFQEHSQGRDPGSHKRNSQGEDPGTFEGRSHLAERWRVQEVEEREEEEDKEKEKENDVKWAHHKSQTSGKFSEVAFSFFDSRAGWVKRQCGSRRAQRTEEVISMWQAMQRKRTQTC